jgi:hypothetical protein
VGQLYGEESSDYLSPEYIQAQINFVAIEVARETLCYPKVWSLATTALQPYVLISADVLAIKEGGVSTVDYDPLPGPYSPQEMQDLGGLGWRDQTGTIRAWYEYGSTPDDTSPVVARHAIGLFPAPTESLLIVRVEGWAIPAAMTEGSDQPPWPPAYHDVLAWGVCRNAAQRDMETNGAYSNRLFVYFDGQYEKQKAALKAAMAGGLTGRKYIRGAGSGAHRNRTVATVRLGP